MAIDTKITPSPEARALFSNMVARATSGRVLHLPMTRTLELAVERRRAGQHDTEEVRELQQEGWIKQARDGGWLIA